jgi:hypothetical protein
MDLVRIRARATVVAAAAAAVLSIGVVAPSATAGAAPSACTYDPVLCPQRLYVGASVPGMMRDPYATGAFTEAVGVSPSVAMYFAAFGDQIDTAALQRLVDDGRLPMLTWEPFNFRHPDTNPYPLRDIAAGNFDDYLRAQAARLAAVDGPVAVRFAHEMNGGWYPWGRGRNGNTDADYVAAYRHVHDVLIGGGADDTVFLWSPNVIDFDPAQDLGTLYPGDGYVDWVGLSAYMDEASDTYGRLVPSTLAQLDRVAPAKPIFFAETAVLPGPTRPQMIRDLVAGFLSTPRLVGFSWFNHVTRFDWRIETDPAAAAALAEALASPYFGSAGHINDPVVAAPVALGPPWITGTAHVGQTLASSTGAWRSAAGSGSLTLTHRWHRCGDPASTSSCTATAGTHAGFTPTQWDVGKFLRVAVTAANAAGPRATS